MERASGNSRSEAIPSSRWCTRCLEVGLPMCHCQTHRDASEQRGTAGSGAEGRIDGRALMTVGEGGARPLAQLRGDRRAREAVGLPFRLTMTELL